MRGIFIILAAFFIISCTEVSDTPPSTADYTAHGVVREISGSASAGEEFTIKLNINLGEGDTYYIVEESVPGNIAILTGDYDSENKIKLVEIQGAISTVYQYTITAPSEPGTYSFTGQYALDNMEEAAVIQGDSELIVK